MCCVAAVRVFGGGVCGVCGGAPPVHRAVRHLPPSHRHHQGEVGAPEADFDLATRVTRITRGLPESQSNSRYHSNIFDLD